METVTENKVLNQEELQILKTIQDETQTVIIELGEIELIQFLNEVSKKEQTFTQSIFEEYGKCNINPQTGEIIPIL
jgi:hypothetical protein